jgi:hypothetical protein
VRRRFQSGVSFQFSYTFSKVLTNACGVDQTNFEPFTDLGNLAYDRGRAEYDTPHVFNGNLLYELPFGRGRRFDVDNPFLNRIVGGWRVTSILSWQSGSPFSIGSRRGTLNRTGRSTQNRAFTNLTVDQVRDLFQIGSDATGPYFVSRSVVGIDGRAVAPDGQPPFSGQVFFNPEPGTLGSLPKLGFNGPSYFNWDFGIQTDRHHRKHKCGIPGGVFQFHEPQCFRYRAQRHSLRPGHQQPDIRAVHPVRLQSSSSTVRLED